MVHWELKYCNKSLKKHVQSTIGALDVLSLHLNIVCFLKSRNKLSPVGFCSFVLLYLFD